MVQNVPNCYDQKDKEILDVLMNNLVSQLSSSVRRYKRLKYLVFSPCFLLVGPLALAAAWALITQPSAGSLLVGIPVLALVFYSLVIQFQQEWIGEYQRLVIMTNIDIQEEIKKAQRKIHLSFGAGHAILQYINAIEIVCSENDIRPFLSFFEESSSEQYQYHSISDILKTTQALHNLLLHQGHDFISAKNQQLIVEDLDEFNATLQSLKAVDLKACVVLLSQSTWNTNIYIAYRQAGYCI